jgi:hypothetical protein
VWVRPARGAATIDETEPPAMPIHRP